MIASALKLCSNSHTVQHCTKTCNGAMQSCMQQCMKHASATLQHLANWCFAKLILSLQVDPMMKLCESNTYPSDLYVDLFLGRNLDIVLRARNPMISPS